MKRIGFIGYGLRSETMMKAFRTLEAPISVAAIADPRWEVIAPTLKGDPYFADTHYYSDADEMLRKETLDGVFIGTRCSLHTPYACKVLEMGLPLFLEKPVCVTREQYDALCLAGEGREKNVVVSFPLRLSTITLEMKRIVDSGVLGKLTMVQAINNVPYGSVYYHSWYRDPSETGGLFLRRPPMTLTTSISSPENCLFPWPPKPPRCISKATAVRDCTARTVPTTGPIPKAVSWWVRSRRRMFRAMPAALLWIPATRTVPAPSLPPRAVCSSATTRILWSRRMPDAGAAA